VRRPGIRSPLDRRDYPLGPVPAFVVSVNVGRPAPLKLGRKTVRSASRKTPVDGPVSASGTSHRPAHEVSIALVQESPLLDRSRLPELEPARVDMLPKLSAWVDGAAG